MNTEELIDFLKKQRSLFAYEQTAMSEARFSMFLEELVNVLSGADKAGET